MADCSALFPAGLTRFTAKSSIIMRLSTPRGAFGLATPPQPGLTRHVLARIREETFQEDPPPFRNVHGLVIGASFDPACEPGCVLVQPVRTGPPCAECRGP